MVVGLPTGTATLDWLDTVTGASDQETVALAGGDQFFDRPAGYGDEVALLVAIAPTEIFADGFENGDTSAWSASIP